MLRILNVVNEKVVLDEHILSVPEFKLLWDQTQEIVYFQYLWATFDPFSPYFNYPELDKEGLILQDYPIDIDNDYFLEAKRKAEELYTSPIKRLLTGTKASIETIADHLQNASISDGRDGNITQITSTISKLPTLIKAYQATEEAYNQEISKARGSVNLGVDEVDYTDDD